MDCRVKPGNDLAERLGTARYDALTAAYLHSSATLSKASEMPFSE
jgi:hypothetical protein